ncbi:MAG: outer membrane beta-barrel protein [Xanthobacteraceae bacterium]|nr:outer membrane beta-barrel protein [Xanthobacteraceae bacterium]
MKIKGILLASAAGVASMPGAQAADLPVKSYPAAAPVAVSWAGLYIGAHAGGASTREFIWDDSYHRASFVGGGQIGYNFQAGNFVYGVEVDGSWISGKRNFTDGSFTYGTHFSWLATARVRAGIALGNWHIYATGGAAFTQIKATDTDCCGPVQIHFKKNVVGWVFGGGVEHMLTRNWIVGAEVLMVDFGSNTLTTSSPLGGIKSLRVSNSAVIGRAKLNYKF